MTVEEIEYRVKLNNLRIKYSKKPYEVIGLCIDSAISSIEFAKEQYRARRLDKFPKGGIVVGENKEPEIFNGLKK